MRSLARPYEEPSRRRSPRGLDQGAASSPFDEELSLGPTRLLGAVRLPLRVPGPTDAQTNYRQERTCKRPAGGQMLCWPGTTRGCSSMVEPQFSKLMTRLRSPSAALGRSWSFSGSSRCRSCAAASAPSPAVERGGDVGVPVTGRTFDRSRRLCCLTGPISPRRIAVQALSQAPCRT